MSANALKVKILEFFDFLKLSFWSLFYLCLVVSSHFRTHKPRQTFFNLFLAFENLTYLSEMFFFFLESLQTFIYCIPVLICFLLSNLCQRRHGAIRDIVRERTKSQRCPEQHRRCLSAVRDISKIVIVIVIHRFFLFTFNCEFSLRIRKTIYMSEENHWIIMVQSLVRLYHCLCVEDAVCPINC